MTAPALFADHFADEPQSEADKQDHAKGDVDYCVVACFSGGRSSAVMVAKMIQALQNGGELPHHHTGEPVKVCERLDAVIFANTGLETPETLDFVWGVAENIIKPAGIPFYAIEFAISPEPPHLKDTKILGKPVAKGQPRHPMRTFRIVRGRGDFSPIGEPWKTHIRLSKNVPNQTRRKCTMLLKVETNAKFVYHRFNTRYFTSALGLRGSEPKRIADQEAYNNELQAVISAGKTPKMGDSHAIFPLAKLGIMQGIFAKHGEKPKEYNDIKNIIADPRGPFAGKWADVARNYNGNKLSNCVGCFYEKGGIKGKAMAFERHPQHAAVWLWTEDYVQRHKTQEKQRHSPPLDMAATHLKEFHARLPARMRTRFTANKEFCWEQAQMLAEKGFDTNTLGFTYGEGGGCPGGHCGADL